IVRRLLRIVSPPLPRASLGQPIAINTPRLGRSQSIYSASKAGGQSISVESIELSRTETIRCEVQGVGAALALVEKQNSAAQRRADPSRQAAGPSRRPA